MFGKTSSVIFSRNSVNDRGGTIFITNHSACIFHYNSVVIFYYNEAIKGGTIYSEASSNVTFSASCKVTFINNLATQYGAAICSLDYSHVIFAGNARAIFYSNDVQLKSDLYFGGIIYSHNNCVISFEDKASTIFRNNTTGIGGAVYISHRCYISFEGNSTTKFIDNAGDYGGAIFSHDNSYISLGGNSTTEFSDNTADYGGAILLYDNSYISFEGNSTTQFCNNTAKLGGAIQCEDNCGVHFEGNSTTRFSGNSANYNGGAIYSLKNSYISFKRNSATMFSNNAADYGGAVLSYDNSYIFLEGSSATNFSDNAANYGGAIQCEDNCGIYFEGNSATEFSNNVAADYGGAIHSFDNSYISFEGNSATGFSNNTANSGGAIQSKYYCGISFKGNSTTVFNNNTAIYGGAIFSYHNSYICLEENSDTEFSDNTAKLGGAIQSDDNCSISFKQNSVAEFIKNTADYGGSICSQCNCHISFKGNSATEFSNNTAHLGGAIFLLINSSLSLEGNSITGFSDNTADGGGAIFSEGYYRISFEENSATEFNNNGTDLNGAIFSSGNSPIGCSTTEFSINTATNHGGATNSKDNCSISIKGNSTVEFSNNIAKQGGAIYSTENNCTISFEGNSTTKFSNNAADYGGAILLIDYSYISFEGNSATEFSDNTAKICGGAIYSSNNVNISFEGSSTTKFSNNTAFMMNGGALFAADQCRMTFDNNSAVFFTNNTAGFDTTILYTYNSKIIVKGNSIYIFNDFPVQWCLKACLKYPSKESDAITIDSNGMVWCSNQQAFTCLSDKCHCKNLEDTIVSIRDNQVVNITDDVVVLSSVIQLHSSNISISGHNNPTVICVNHGGLKFYDCSNLTIEGITFIGCGAADSIYDFMNIHIPVLEFSGCNNVRIQKCSFRYSMGRVVWLENVSGYVNFNNCKFVGHIHYRGQGAAILYESSDNAFDEVIISNCNFSSYKAEAVIYFTDRLHGYNTYLYNSSFQNNEGVSIYLTNHHILHVNGEVLFENNVAEDGTGIYITDHSTVIFGENSNVKFINNSANYFGAAIFLCKNSTATFDNNSIVTFNDNVAGNGTIYSKIGSNVIFRATCEVSFRNNLATQHGSAIYSYDNSQIIFKGNSRVSFNTNAISSDNAHTQNGGAMLSENNGNIVLEENSITRFGNNSGSAIFSIHNSNVTFKDTSRVTFINNIAHYCGVLTSALFSTISFTGDTKVMYDSNTVSYTLTSEHDSSAGTICTFQRSEIIFTEHSLVTFINNKADRGGAVIIFDNNVIIEKYSIVIFNNNVALYSSGGAFVCSNNSNVTIKGNSNVTFNNNKASQSGGAIHSYNMCRITFKDNSTSTFINNTARDNGGALLSSSLSEISFQDNSVVIFDGNTADNGGVFYFTNSTIIFKESSVTSFNSNKARQRGGVGYFNFNSQVMFEGTITIKFDNNIAEKIAGVLYSAMSNIQFKENCTISVTNNKATFDGGGLYFDRNSDVLFTEFANITFKYNKAFYGGAIVANDHSNITVTRNAVLLFVSNEATQSGGAGYFNCSCNFIITQNSMVKFYYNKAFQGGAVCINDYTKFMIIGKSTTPFQNNLATVTGGAIIILNESIIILDNHIDVKFINNNAQYGGAIFLDTTSVLVNSSYINCINFTSNVAKVLGNSIYQDTAAFCNSSCLSNRIVNTDIQFLATPPNELKFYYRAICIDNDQNVIHCSNYYMQDVMLGTEIMIPACVLDYYNQSVNSTQFLVEGEIHSNCFISGSKETLISCDTFKGISIMSNKTLTRLTNFSVSITLNTVLNSQWKQISVNLIIELSPCHPGFWQYPKSRTCECYNASNIVFCSGSSSTIKRGYWFGNVTGKPTVIFCPINYCNFTCCETSNGYYHLSPVRDNQCRSHRSGAACSSCEEGYTLSFDSVECVHFNECSIGWTILVLALVVLYWIIIIAAVFSLVHFKVGLGNLYAITYYYSVVDLLLSRNWYHSDAIYTTINVMSSIAKIIPQFLGKFCLITSMSGIDQQFIHYIHPVAISLFLVMITVLARRSRRLSHIISKGIIRVICCLLLLSYTSLATTSLLLMRPLIFHDVNKVYTYVSPDVEYFHGRHLVYVIVAVLFTVVIVIGLPLLLAFEPFLNSKVNFIKIKPLLDQFQGCYKDKYRCFAAYYMICRLMIVTIVLINSFNDLFFQYLLITICIVIAILHQLFRPYSSSLLNKFDGFILQLLALVSAPPLTTFHDTFDSSLVVVMIFVLVALPSLVFITISLMLNKEKFEKLLAYCYIKCLQLWRHNEIPPNEIPLIVNEGSSEFYNIIDDSKRINAIICDM